MMRVDAWYLAVEPCDMRAGMDSLLARVVHVFGAAKPHVAYAFANVRATRMKVLVSDGFGLWLCARRLQSGCLSWPRKANEPVQLNHEQWRALTVGLAWQRLDQVLKKT